MDEQGLFLCAKYAVSPNFFGYCGPRKSTSLIDHLKDNIADLEVEDILSNFETLYPYLQLIARANKISDPFDRRVVEAYWIGNSLLKPVSVLGYQAFSKEKLVLDKKLSKIEFKKLLNNIYQKPFLPHHAFHVFNIFRRTGHNSSYHTLETMDNCRISYGKVIRYELQVISVTIETKQLIVNNKQLALTKSTVKDLKVDYKGKQFLKNLVVGDWVSFHWGFVCDILTEKQVENLEFYTQKAIDFYNR